MTLLGGSTRRDCRCGVTFERTDLFFALAAKPVKILDVAVFGAKIDV